MGVIHPLPQLFSNALNEGAKMNTIKQYAAFLQQNPNMTQEFAMELLGKTRLQIKNYERVAGIKLTHFFKFGLTVFSTHHAMQISTSFILSALNKVHFFSFIPATRS